MPTRSAFPGVALMLMLAVPLGAQTDRPAATAKPQGPMPNFTGTVANVEATDVRGVRFRYDAGARSYWHVHDGSLVLLIEQGRGRFQIKGQPIREFGPGEPIVLPANVPHWHGASPGEGLTWVALSIGRNVKWMEPVSEEEYLGKNAR
jgi:quercetin dioxygenase-like cupin family protein